MAVIQFKRSTVVLPSADLALAPGNSSGPAGAKIKGVDLKGKRKVLFLIGRGRVGKTFLARWLAEVAEERGSAVVVAACDPVNRSLRNFVAGVAEPPSADPVETKVWLMDLIGHLQAEKLNGIVDLGGGDASLGQLIHEMPDLHTTMSDAGLEPVAVHVVGPDQHDLSPLAQTERAGFQPTATAIVFNEGLGRSERFQPIVDHPAFQAVIGRGGVQLSMPILTPDIARLVDAHHVQFKNVAHLGPFAASAVHGWLRRMRDAFEPVESWFPE